MSILSIKNGTIFEVKSTAGNTHLGGEDFDHRMVKYFIEEIKSKYSKDISNDPRATSRLLIACEKAKRTLSSCTTTSVELDGLYDGLDFHSKITRAKFDELNIDLFRNTIESVKFALNDAKITKQNIDEIVLVGGSTRIPKVQALLKDFFEGKKQLNNSINPDEAVACGAAIQAAIIAGDTSSNIQQLLLIDVTPLSLGIETKGGVMTKLIERNTKIPAKAQNTFTTTKDNQLVICFPVYEGERIMTNDNRLLGEFELSGIPPACRNEPQVTVVFDIDVNGILNVMATEEKTKKSNNIQILNTHSHFSKAGVDRMVQDAIKYKADDEKQRDSLHAQNELENYLVEIRSFAMKYKGEEQKKLLDLHSESLKWLDQNNSAEKLEYYSKIDELRQMVSLHSTNVFHTDAVENEENIADNSDNEDIIDITHD